MATEKKGLLSKGHKWYPILIGLLSLAVLGINLMVITKLFEGIEDTPEVLERALNIQYGEALPSALALFGTLILLHLVQCIATYREEKYLFVKHLAYIICSIVPIVILLANGVDSKSWSIATICYLAAALIGRIVTVIHKRSKWNIFLLILMIFVCFIGACTTLITMYELDEGMGYGTILSIGVLFLLVDLQAVLSIAPIAFSHIRMDILRKIIKKTYAVEILLGILLLIVAFSLVLPAFEPEINNFGDALWYCFAIVTTIGFGDLTAVTLIGRVLSVILGLYGIIVVSLITSIVVNFYGEMKKEEKEEGEKSKEAVEAEET